MSKIKILALLICILVLIVFSGCGKNQKAGVFYVDKSDAATEVSAEGEKSLYFSKKTKDYLTKIVGSDMIALFMDKESLGISVYDVVSKKLWSSLPEEYAGVKTGALMLEVLLDGNSYILNSQSDSLAEGNVKYEQGDNFLKVIYRFEKNTNSGAKIDITVPITYTLESGTLHAEVDCNNLASNENEATVKSISILPFFGACLLGEKGDYILVPDGTGAIIDISEKAESFSPLSFPVYGADAAKNESTEQKVTIGAFGMKSGESAFVALIEEGAEIGEIRAEKALKNSGYNSVGAVFEITPTAELQKDKTVVSKESYKGKISISYRFLSYENADYMGMASATRELLIRNKSLPMNKKQADGSYPFNLSLIGSGYNEKSGRAETLTSFSQAYDILTTLKAKGIGDINVRYRGAFDGGMDQHNIKKADISLGTKGQLSQLANYCQKQSIELFADVSLFTATVKKSFGEKSVAITGDFAEKESDSFQKEKSHFLTPKKISEAASSLIAKIRATPFSGICLADGGKHLYSDFSKNNIVLRTETAEHIFTQSAALASNKKLMVDTGNLYSIKYAEEVVNLPSTASCKGKDYCTQVPFVSGILHGTVEYSLTPINTAKVSETMFLRYVEYGAVPYFEWYYHDDTHEKSTDKYCYTNSISEAQLYYARMAKSLSDLRAARITDHGKVKKNVYMTEYDGSTKVYVNYNETAVTVGGVTVEPRSFVRVN